MFKKYKNEKLLSKLNTFIALHSTSVSYTHLDVYKRQVLNNPVPRNNP